MFAQFFVWMDVHDKAGFWTSFLSLLSEHHHAVDPSTVYRAIEEHLALYGCTMVDFAIPPPSPEAALLPAERAAQEYARELRSPMEMCKEKAEFDRLALNDDQKSIFEFVRSRVDGAADPDAATVIYIDGPAGTGKTHVYRKVLHYVRMTGRIALAVAMSGIAALLLPGGRTAHSRFRLPVPVPLEGCKANVKPQSAAARLIRDAAVLIWDEAPTASRAMFEAVDKCMQELLGDSRPFGGKTVILGGDFRQIPPVLRYLDRDAVQNHTLAAMPWWESPHVHKFRLEKNMRANLDHAFATFCLRVGDGTCEGPPFPEIERQFEECVVELPPEVLAPHDWTPRKLLEWVYEGFEHVPPARWYQYYADRAVVTPTNEAADTLNATMQERLPAETEITSRSHDVAFAEVDNGDTYTPEFLHGLQTAGLPPHVLRLRRGSLVILLRNFAPHRGLCNGTRLVVERMHSYFLVCRIVTGPFAGNVELMPRITCDSCWDSELPFVLRRHQFPVKPAWVITINKSQGQSMQGRLGVYLPRPVFAHGQLYVALSRGASFETTKVLVEETHASEQGVREPTGLEPTRAFTCNIVDASLLRAARASEPRNEARAGGDSEQETTRTSGVRSEQPRTPTAHPSPANRVKPATPEPPWQEPDFSMDSLRESPEHLFRIHAAAAIDDAARHSTFDEAAADEYAASSRQRTANRAPRPPPLHRKETTGILRAPASSGLPDQARPVAPVDNATGESSNDAHDCIPPGKQRRTNAPQHRSEHASDAIPEFAQTSKPVGPPVGAHRRTPPPALGPQTHGNESPVPSRMDAQKATTDSPSLVPGADADGQRDDALDLTGVLTTTQRQRTAEDLPFKIATGSYTAVPGPPPACLPRPQRRGAARAAGDRDSVSARLRPPRGPNVSLKILPACDCSANPAAGAWEPNLSIPDSVMCPDRALGLSHCGARPARTSDPPSTQIAAEGGPQTMSDEHRPHMPQTFAPETRSHGLLAPADTAAPPPSQKRRRTGAPKDWTAPHHASLPTPSRLKPLSATPTWYNATTTAAVTAGRVQVESTCGLHAFNHALASCRIARAHRFDPVPRTVFEAIALEARVGDSREELVDPDNGNYDVAVLTTNCTAKAIAMFPLTPEEIQERLFVPFQPHHTLTHIGQAAAYIIRLPSHGGHWVAILPRTVTSCTMPPSCHALMCDSMYSTPHAMRLEDVTALLTICAHEQAFADAHGASCEWRCFLVSIP